MERLTPHDILGPGGSIARRLKDYEERPQQLEMARAVAEAISAGRHLVVEAGTGVGKSFAYLVPAVLAVTEGEGGNSPDEKKDGIRRVVISTHTISLQEQLLLKDVPLVSAVVPREFSCVLVKGRGNYLSKRRLQGAVEKSSSLFGDNQEMEQLRAINQWSRETNDGSLADLSFQPLSGVWDEVASDGGNCLGRKCPTHGECFYFAARRRAQHAQVLLVNHALFFRDLALRQVGASLLPDYDAVIFDEAHTLEGVAGQHLGLSVSSGQIEYILGKLYNDRTQRGLLVHHGLQQAQRQVESCRHLIDEFFGNLEDWFQRQPSGFNGRVQGSEIVENRLSPSLTELADTLRSKGRKLEDESQAQDFYSASDRLRSLAGELEHWRLQEMEEAVYWVERRYTRRGRPRMALSAAPLEVGAALRDQLFNETRSVVLTSATLAVGKPPSFEFFQSRIGLAKTGTLRLGSPFDYHEQAKLIVVRDMPDPQSERQDFERQCVAMIQRYVAASEGRAFVLFTNYEMMRRTASQLTGWLVQNELSLFSQSDGLPRTQMLEQFRRNPRSVLFGVDSFWQGVDVPGEALVNVIITKLPFSVPSDPLIEARLEAIKARGGNPFKEFQVPEAVIKLRQGFGRLIRSRQDTGQVVILDPRVRTKSYGKTFLDSLPECEVVEESVAGSGERASQGSARF